MNKKHYGKGIPKVKLDYSEADFLIQIEGFARDGYDDKQIASILGVAANTFSRNKQRKLSPSEENPKGESLLSRALKKGRAPLSVEVENSLYKRATGMHVKKISTTEQFMRMPDGTKTETKIIKTVTEIIELPPDTTAAIFWLKNHKPNLYNCQPLRVNTTSDGKDLVDPTRRISTIEHIIISDREIEKLDIESL
jgi:hypothetical protein